LAALTKQIKGVQMENKALVIMISIIILLGGLLLLLVTFFPAIWSLISPRAFRPEIRYGEFDFRLEYEIYGEVVVVEDTVVVEHSGTSWDAGIGNHNVWDNHLKSGREFIELYRSDAVVIFIRILGVLNGVYLLGTDSVREDLHTNLPDVTRLNLNEEGLTSQQEQERDTFFSDNSEPNWRFFGGARWHINEEDLFNNYGIRLIRFEYDLPIENSFR